MFERLVIAEISLNNLTHNFTSVKKLLKPKTQIMSILKANAYGHGAVEIAKHLEKIGTDQIGIVCLFEARLLREAGIKIPILIMNYSDPDTFQKAMNLDISLNIMDEQSLKFLDKIARSQKKVAKVHVKVDTGMHRLGLSPEEAFKFISRIENYKNIFLEGVFSHFATADESNLEFTNQQLNIFNTLINQLLKKKINPPLLHIANSAATLRLQNSHLGMVRPGTILYGSPPSLNFKPPFTPKPILTLKTQIVQIRRIHSGETVSYGRNFQSKKGNSRSKSSSGLRRRLPLFHAIMGRCAN